MLNKNGKNGERVTDLCVTHAGQVCDWLRKRQLVKPVCKWFYFWTWFSKSCTFLSAASPKKNHYRNFSKELKKHQIMLKVSFTFWICIKSKHDKIVWKRSIQLDYFTCLFRRPTQSHVNSASMQMGGGDSDHLNWECSLLSWVFTAVSL